MILDETTELPLQAAHLCFVDVSQDGKSKVRQHSIFGHHLPDEAVNGDTETGVHLLPEVQEWLEENCAGRWDLKAPRGTLALRHTLGLMISQVSVMGGVLARFAGVSPPPVKGATGLVDASKIIFYDLQDAVHFKIKWWETND